MSRYHLRSAAAAAAAIVLASCVGNLGDSDLSRSESMVVNEAGIEVNSSSLEQGHVRILVSSDFNEQKLTPSAADSRRLESELVDNLGAVVKKMGVYRVERTFPYAGEFEARTRAAGLDRWYDVYFESDCPISEYLAVFNSASVVEMTELRPRLVALFTEDAQVDEQAPAANPSASAVFNDPGLREQWHYINDGSRKNSVKGCDINVEHVWSSISTGNPDVIVAVVDGGIDYAHEDLAANMWHNPDQSGSNVYGYNFNRNTYTIEPANHGTHVAGTIAAVNNNGIGVSGIAGGNSAKGQAGVKLMSCQILGVDGKGTGSAPAAIKWAADHGAVICQNSWSYEKATIVPASDRAAIDYFNTYAGFDAAGNQVGPMAGGIVIFAAGNESRNYSFPALYEGVLSVAAVGADFEKAYYSNFGDWVNVSAPGGDSQKGNNVYSTLPGNKYGTMQGTSMACPHVSGIAALIVSRFGGPGFTRTMLWNRIVNTTTSLAPYTSANIGGLVNTLAAMSSFGEIAPGKVEEASAKPMNSNFIEVSVKVPADEDDGQAFGVNVYYSKTPFSSTNGIPFKAFYFEGAKAGETFKTTMSGLDFSTHYYLRLEAFDLAGNRGPISEPVTVTTAANGAPVINCEIKDVIEVRAHETKRFNITYSDPDGHAMQASLKTKSQADSLFDFIDSRSQLTIIGNLDKPGRYNSKIVVVDEYDARSEFEYTFVIYANHAPVVLKEIPSQLFTSIGASVTLPLDEYFYDEDGEVLECQVASSSKIVSASVSNGNIYVTASRVGSDLITIRMKDAAGEVAESSFEVVVRNADTVVDVYPVPVTSVLTIRTGEKQEDAHIVITNVYGAKVYDAVQKASAFKPAIVDMSSFAAGVYHLVVEYGGKTSEQDFVKV